MRKNERGPTEVTCHWTDSDSGGEEEREYEVDVAVTPGRAGNHHGHPDTWEPDEGVELEIVAVRDDEGRECPALVKRLDIDDLSGLERALNYAGRSYD
jgi:hypothetical protein